MCPGYTYLFEIVYPENRIVVDYEDTEELFVLGVIKTDTGEEAKYEEMTSEGFKLVKKYDGVKSFEELKSLNTPNAEGFVIRFRNGYRMKIKFADYCALHRIMTSCSSYDIWENLMKFGKVPEDLLTKVPDEFYNWIKRVEKDLWIKHTEMYNKAHYEYEVIMKALSDVPQDEFDKTYALLVKNKENASLLFSLKNGRDISEAIWKKIKPAYEKPFMDAG
jgi:RNA ligase